MNDTRRRFAGITGLSFAHLVNDWYMNYLQVMLPLLAVTIGMARAAWLVTAFTLTSSIVQPVFGVWLGRHPGRWPILVGTAWMAILLSLVALCDNYALALTLAALAGLGTAVFHPAASSLVAALAGDRKSFVQSLFMAGGNLGWALAPLLFVPFSTHFGLEKSPLIIVPGVIAIVFLFAGLPPSLTAKKTAHRAAESSQVDIRSLSFLLFTIACRSLAYFGLITFLPIYLASKGISLLSGSRFIFTMLLAGAAGGIVGGYLADRVGKKKVLLTSLLLASPLLFLFIATQGVSATVIIAVAGAVLLASFSITVVMAQELLPDRMPLAAGLTLGFGQGIGGLGVGILGSVVERVGATPVVYALMALPIVASALALGIRQKAP